MSKFQIGKDILNKQTLALPINKSKYRQIIFPCHLGIIFIGNVSTSMLNKLRFHLDQTFDSFFFDIQFIDDISLHPDMFELRVKEEHNLLNKSSEKVLLQPTNKFYEIIVDKKSEYNLDIGLGLTNLPIYSSNNEKLLFLFGEAHIKYMCAIVSTHNLRDLFNLEDLKLKKIEKRIYKEVIHEIGHLILGCGHCFNNYCVMHFSKNIKEIDSKSINLCKKCKLKLEKVRERDNF